jgi:3-hydroxyisobutyrate dehydrogenase
MTRVLVIGLGAMGLPMARTLAQAGFAVTGCDTDADRRAAFPGAVDHPGTASSGAQDAVLLSLPNDEAVRAVASALPLPAGAVVIDTSTVAPDTSRDMQAALAERGIGYVDAPVSGGAAGAASGQLLVMAGGTDPDMARARPVLDALARLVVLCGGPGAGATVKLANNLLCAGHLVLVGEALRMAEAGGVEADALLSALNAGSGRSAVSEVNLPRWVLSGAFDSGFTLGLMAKDLGLAAALPGAGRQARGLADRWRDAATRLGPGEDFNRIVLDDHDRP